MSLANEIIKHFKNVTLNLESTYEIDLEYQKYDKMIYFNFYKCHMVYILQTTLASIKFREK